MEQTEVETYFIRQGYLLPKYHKSYWMGLRATQWPNFAWIDNTVNKTSYQHWGQYIEGELIQPEPNNFENCAGGNFTQSYGKAAGWDDQNCDTEYIHLHLQDAQ